MSIPQVDLADRVTLLERSLHRARLLAAGAALTLAALASLGFAARATQPEPDTLRVRRIEVVDDQGVVRLVLGQDPKQTDRRARAAGLLVFDKAGAERGGFSTLDDGSVVFAMDAPAGVGAAMRDRLGLVVWPDGSSYVMLLDNQTHAVAKLESDGKGGGGVQVFDWDTEAREVNVKTFTFDGEVVATHPLGK
jgi:hypothetical protein